MDTPLRIAALLLAVMTATPVAASEVYKCVARGATSYQSAPCARGDSETRMTFAGAPAPAPHPGVVASAPPSRQHTLRPGPWRHQTLTLGMSDDEVLNLPGWGRPARIDRTRTPRAWQEVWTYGNGVSGLRQLYFTNARLFEIADAPSTQVALTLR